MGTGERSSVATVVFRLFGHSEIRPKLVFDQSTARMSAPFSPPPNGKCLSYSVPLTFGIAGIFWALRFRLEAIFVLLASSSNILNWIVKRLIKRPRPTSELVTVARVINEPSFPSGHVMHYVNFFGLLNYLLATNWRSGRLRNILLTVSTALIVLIGPSRVYLGAHWPSDVMAGYVYGGLWFGGLMTAYLRVKSWIHPPAGKTPEVMKPLQQPGDEE